MTLTSIRKSIIVAAILLVVACIGGCGADAPRASGVVRFDDGEPVRSGSVEFRSLSDGTRYASRISDDGSFRLTNEDGAASLLGDYEVVVVQIVLTEDLAAADHTHGRTVPRRYADYYTSDLRFTKLVDNTDPIVVVLNQ